MESFVSLNPVIMLLIVSAFTALIVHLHYSGKMRVLSEKHAQLLSQIEALNKELDKEKLTLNHTDQKWRDMQQENVLLQNEIAHLHQKIETSDEREERQQKQFEYIAQKILTKSAQRVSDLHQKDLHTMLSPLSNEIKQYREKVEQNTLESVKGHAALKETVQHLAKNTEVVSEQANKLVETLKMDHKKQGVWGEMILESILDKSGLVKDREYHVQLSLKDHEGSVKRPDVILDLPDGKKLIIDAKVSLKSFERLIQTNDKVEADQHKKAHLLAVRNHINRLADKKYHDLYQIDSPDFVFMFVPLDNAYAVALDQDPALHDYAYRRNVIVATSSTLMTVLKTAESLWRIDKQNRNAIEIAEEAGKMYDKFMNVLHDLNKLGDQMKTANKTYDNTMNKFVHGQGNLIRRAEKIKGLGAKANKALPSNILQKVV